MTCSLITFSRKIFLCVCLYLDYSDQPYTRKHDLDELFRVIKERHQATSLPVLLNVQHPDLLPWLRPYQQQAISWMVHKEREAQQKETDVESKIRILQEVIGKSECNFFLYANGNVSCHYTKN